MPSAEMSGGSHPVSSADRKELTAGVRAAVPRHIVLYIGSLQMGGAEHVMVNLAEALFARGWRVTFVTTYFAEREYEVPHGLWRMLPAGEEPREEELEAASEFFGAGDGSDPDHCVIYALTPEERRIPVEFRAWLREATPSPVRRSGDLALREDAEPPMADFHTAGYGAAGNGIDRWFSGISSAEVRGRLTGLSRRMVRLEEIWRSLKPDVILSFIGKNNLMALLTARKLNIPVIVSVRATPLEEYPTKTMRLAANFLFPRAAAVVLQTAGSAGFFSPRVREKTVVMPNAVSAEFLGDAPSAGGEAVPDAGGREKTIVMVGRLDANKHVDMLLRVFAGLLRDDGYGHDAGPVRNKQADTAGGNTQNSVYREWRILIYGDGEDREKLETEAGELGIADRAVFLGQQPGIAEKIRSAGIYCLLSGREGMPNALIEAMCLGLPCITTDCITGGIGQLVRDGEDALVIPPGDEAGLTRALRRLMDDPALGKRLGENAKLLRERYRPERVYDAWEKLLIRTAAEGKHY